ncbi:uncharacterized protein LOC104898156 [Beta vulgaris subsp. vulgaris]|uniref:uncharacterized protein LOC104898156 n=1 Tax=Beta vulgaris subsp. vulgaris TaxID=3555 RepID=UPI0005400FDF|nr:uncharacterized protein LOC104898156 [Beta vulgaris subsp. vulgaris]
MVKGLWSRITPSVLKWAAFYDEALTRKRSGQNHYDVLQEAHLFHNKKHGRFLLEHAWIMMKIFPKWMATVKKSLENPRGRRKAPQETVDSPRSRSSSKRSRVDGRDSMPNTPTSGEECEVKKRPEGEKKVKSRLKGVAGEIIECFNSFNERLRLHLEFRSRHTEREREMLEVQKEKVALKKQQMEVATRSLNLQ